MTHRVAIGQRFGDLTVFGLEGRGAGKARLANCFCECGNVYPADIGQLLRGITKRCRECSKPKKRWSDEESHVRKQYINYRGGAARRGYDYRLSLDEFRGIYFLNCYYCGKTPAKGIDRRDNSQGYLLGNCVPCCKDCNLAKRDMTERDFLSWISRISSYQGFAR